VKINNFLILPHKPNTYQSMNKSH